MTVSKYEDAAFQVMADLLGKAPPGSVPEEFAVGPGVPLRAGAWLGTAVRFSKDLDKGTIRLYWKQTGKVDGLYVRPKP